MPCLDDQARPLHFKLGVGVGGPKLPSGYDLFSSLLELFAPAARVRALCGRPAGCEISVCLLKSRGRSSIGFNETVI